MLKSLTVAALALAGTSAACSGSITVVPPTGANYVPQYLCPSEHGLPGWTRLDALVFDGPETLSLLHADQFMNSRVNAQFVGNWSFQLSTALSATVTVNKYKAHDDPGSCQHGGEISWAVSNVMGLPAGQALQMVQVLTEDGDSGIHSGQVDPPSGEHIPILDADGNEVGTHTTDTLPFYSDDTAASALSFFDWPSDTLADTGFGHAGGVSFVSYITSWDGHYDAGQTEVVTIYGAIEWGYSYECTPIPTPGTLTLAAVGLLWRRRRSRTH